MATEHARLGAGVGADSRVATPPDARRRHSTHQSQINPCTCMVCVCACRVGVGVHACFQVYGVGWEVLGAGNGSVGWIDWNFQLRVEVMVGVVEGCFWFGVCVIIFFKFLMVLERLYIERYDNIKSEKYDEFFNENFLRKFYWSKRLWKFNLQKKLFWSSFMF